MINRSKIAAAKARSQPLGSAVTGLGSVAKTAGMTKGMAGVARKLMGGMGGSKTGIGTLVKQSGKVPPEVVRRMGLGGGSLNPENRKYGINTGPTKQPGTMPQGFRPGVTPPPRAMANAARKVLGPLFKKFASGGLAAGHKAADGIAKKGKTKGTEVKMSGKKSKKYC